LIISGLLLSQKDARQGGIKMAYMPVGKIFKDSDSIFKLTIIAARRAVELNNGANKLITTATTKFSTIALEEIAAGKVKYRVKGSIA
jgi:DNA-directed RNA polymerase subunit omega